MVNRARTTHAAGGPATVGGVDYEIDCALADALEMVERLLIDPLCDGTLTPQARLGIGDELTAWDYGGGTEMAVEAKGNATKDDAADWVERSRVAAGSPGERKFRLTYGEVTGGWEKVLSRYIALAAEAETDERLRELAEHDRLARPAWLTAPTVSLLRRLELRHIAPSDIAHRLETHARTIFSGKPEAALPAMRQRLREAARKRQAVWASALLAVARGAGVEPREMQARGLLDESDARRVIFFLLCRCENPLPLELLRDMLGPHAGGLDEAVASLVALRRAAPDVQGAFVLRQGAPVRTDPENGAAILDRLLQLLLSAIETGAPWAKQPTALRLACELCVSPGPQPRTVATAFGALDKPLKDLGDVRLVRRTAEACVAAARAAPRTEQARRGEAQALICGVSWAKQRMGGVEEARSDAQRSKEIGEHLPWPRNTAFCGKCIGRLLRLEGAAKPPGTERDKLLGESVAELRGAIDQFGKLDEMTEAERQAEIGACYSLLGRTFLEIGNQGLSRAAIEQAKGLVGESKKKDVADLWILQGEYEARWGTAEYARVAFGHALEATSDRPFEVAEMRARAFEQRAGVAGSVKAALDDLAQAVALFTKLGDADGAARAEFAAMRREGRVPPGLDAALATQTSAVAVKVVQIAEAERGERGSAVAYRDAMPDRVILGWISQARRQAVIEDGEAAHVAVPARESGPLPVTPRPPAVRARTKRPKESLAAVFKRIVPRARDAAQAARMLAAELTGANPEPPIRLKPIAQALDIESIEAVELGRTGELRRDDDGALSIVYSKDLRSGRRRFTIAHELGHAVLTVRGDADVTESYGLEQFCDIFAGALLMPEACLPKLPSPVTVEALRDIARRFEVSLPTAAIRLQRAYGGFRAFGVENERVIWTAGDVSRGAVSLLPDMLREVIAAALGGTEVPAEIFAYGGRWAVSTRPSDKRSLSVVLSPRDPKVRQRTYSG